MRDSIRVALAPKRRGYGENSVARQYPGGAARVEPRGKAFPLLEKTVLLGEKFIFFFYCLTIGKTRIKIKANDKKRCGLQRQTRA